MQNLSNRVRRNGWNAALGLVGMLGIAGAALRAFPPAPFHRVSGMVRNEMGDPLNMTNAVVLMETQTGAQMKASVIPNLGPGRNYFLNVPMDAGVTADNYKVGAVRAAASFRMKVRIGGMTYLPLETAIRPGTLGAPAGTTRLDLTLGEDSDGDGLPDAWERALLAMLGNGKTLADIRPGDDSDGDGISNSAEYRAGTYAFDPADGFRLDKVGRVGERMAFEFLAIPGRRYSILASTDLKEWRPVAFRLSADSPGTAPRTSLAGSRTQLMRIEVVSDAPDSGAVYKAVVE